MSEITLLDTHVVLWLLMEPEQLSAKAHDAIARARHAPARLGISCVSLWEIALLAERGRVKLNQTAQVFLHGLENVLVVMPVTADVAYRAACLSPDFPRDPMDRLIAATAIVNQADLVTKDDRIHKSGEVSCIW